MRATDPAGNEATDERLIRVDRTAPLAPRRLAVAGGTDWRNANEFGVNWTAPPEVGTAPIVGAEYSFCPASNGPYDNAGCVQKDATLDGSESMHPVAVPGEGAWTLRVALRDAAGNVDTGSTGSVEGLRFDATNPIGQFEAMDPRDPTRIRLTASDAQSGVDRVEVEVRRAGADEGWRPLTVVGDGRSYSATVDDSSLAAGVYDVRARIVDRAQNERTITSAGGSASPLRLTLPVRVANQLTVGKPERVRIRSAKRGKPKYKQVLKTAPVADFGDTVGLAGKLLDVAGNPRPDALIEVFELIGPATDWRYVGNAKTNSSGSFGFRVPAGPSRRLRFSYAGTSTNQPSVKELALTVRAKVTIKPDRHTLRNGDDVIFRGALQSGPVPDRGKLLALQALTTRGWRTFANPRARSTDGKWSFRYRFTSTSVRTRYSFRVVAPAEAGYPYARSVSPTTRVLVTP